jgi:hypothetical protein
MAGTLRFAHLRTAAIFPERETARKSGWTRIGPHFIDFDFG